MGERGHRILIALLLASGGCLIGACLGGCMTGPIEPSQESVALGEPTGDYPDYDERVVLYATNRDRVDPTKAGWSSYPAVPPLQWNYQLNESSRAHSIDMRDTPCFQHNSCDGTDCFTRVNSYYTAQWSSEGENISAGVPDAVTAVYNWIYEIGAAAGETGHRDNIFSKDFTLMGSGFASGGTQYQNYWTQDFIGTTVPHPALTDGIHFPVTAKTGATLTYGVTWYDSAGGAPTSLSVVVDGKCNPLTLARGGDGMAAYEAVLSFADGCHPYYFLANKGGTISLYPSGGSLQAGYGTAGASCTLYQASQAPSNCGGGGTTNPTPAPGARDMGGSGIDGFNIHPPGSGAQDMTPAKSGGDGGIIGPTTGTNGGAPVRRNAGGCSTTGDSPNTTMVWALLAIALVVRNGNKRKRARPL